jgi:ABC-type transport system involved in multi-copper enzyme maturation permease subunit
VNGGLAVARYTLLELSRRRILLVFFIIGAAGIALLATLLKLFSSVLGGNIVVVGPNGAAPDPEKVRQAIELGFVNDLIAVLGLFTLLIAFGIGMTVIYHDLDSGAAVSIFTKPVSRLAFTVGKVAAAVIAMIVIIGALSLEARAAMFLFGGGLENALWFETLAGVGNALTLMLLVLALSTWMNNIVAAVVAFIYNAVAGIVVTLHEQLVAGNLGNNEVLQAGLNIVYWLVPHRLVSDAPREIARAQFELFNPARGRGNGPTADQVLAGIPGASGTADIVWWLFVVGVFCLLVYVAVRRKQV